MTLNREARLRTKKYCLLTNNYQFANKKHEKNLRSRRHQDNIYRISSRFSEPDDSFNLALTQFPLGPTVKEELSEISQYVRFFTSGRIAFSKDNETYFVEDFYHVDSTVFDVFSF